MSLLTSGVKSLENLENKKLMVKNLVPIVSIPEVATIVDIRDEIEEVKSFYFTLDLAGNRGSF